MKMLHCSTLISPLVSLFASASRLGTLLFSVLVSLTGLQGQSNDPAAYSFTTLAGHAGHGSTDGTGSAAQFYGASGMAADSVGNVYLADSGNGTIRKITPAGVTTTFAGKARVMGTADGTGGDARFANPNDVAVDGAGNIYVSDGGNHTIRKITPAGVVTTLAGTAGSSGSADGTGIAARFSSPSGVTVDTSGNLYVADSGNYTIRKITPTGVVTTLAGTAGSTGSVNGTGSAARFSGTRGVTVDASGNVYVADAYFINGVSLIRKITADGVVTTFAGAVTNGYVDDIGTAARFDNPADVAVDALGNVYVADSGNRTIRKITSAGVVTTLAGDPLSVDSPVDGSGSAAHFVSPDHVAVDNAGNVYVTDFNDNVADAVRKITPAGVVTTLAGALDGGPGSADGTGSAARFRMPGSVAADGAGNIYVGDTANNTIRKITSTGVVTTLAGLSGSNNAGLADGTGSAAQFNAPGGVAVDDLGDIYVADTGNHAIRKITAAGVVTTLVGNTQFSEPVGIALDSLKNVYFTDSLNNTIWKIDAALIVSVFAGTAGEVGSIDGFGSVARFKDPRGIAWDKSGNNIYVADFNNHTIRKITATGFVSTFAGSADAPPGSIDGIGVAARFNNPVGLTVDDFGNIYVTELGRSVIRKITSAGVVTTIGNWAFPYGSTDGTRSTLDEETLSGLTVDGEGKLYVVDSGNNTIFKGTPQTGVAPTITTQPMNQAVIVGGSVTFIVVAGGSPAPTYQWKKGNADIGGATSSSYTIATAAPGDAGSYTVEVTNASGSVTSDTATLNFIPAGFDVASYLARYPEVAVVFGADHYGAWLYYRDHGIYDGEVFDDLFRVEEYLTLYPELFAIFGDDLSGALLHWLNEGSIEGRLGRIPLEFSATGYLSRNADVAAAVNNDPLLAWSHYWLYGIYEGRAYDDELDVFQYLAINADLTAAFVNDWRAAALHWMRYGRTEGRLGRLPLLFNVNEYLTRSPDVAAVWGTHPTTVFLHYWGYGIDEGRTFDDEFRPLEYLALNADLAAVFGTDKRGAFKHWVRYGKTEGRPGKNP